MANFIVTSETGFDMELMRFSGYWDGAVRSSTLVEEANHYTATSWERLLLVGEGFAPPPEGWFPGAGTVHRVIYESTGGAWQLDGLGAPVVDFQIDWNDPAAELALRAALLDGVDDIFGQHAPDRLRGYAGDDQIFGRGGNDHLQGNAGNDVVFGEEGDDWVVGGKDDDDLYGDSTPWDYAEGGADIVLGNLGADTCNGGPGADTLRGGQGDDNLWGEAGDDWLAGDRGADTISGGAGADTFHSHGEAGLDRVVDFSATEGDRVNLLRGTTYEVAQLGADTVISMTGGGQMVLAGVQLSTLSSGWIFEG